MFLNASLMEPNGLIFEHITQLTYLFNLVWQFSPVRFQFNFIFVYFTDTHTGFIGNSVADCSVTIVLEIHYGKF
jgi:hypothetical protein